MKKQILIIILALNVSLITFGQSNDCVTPSAINENGVVVSSINSFKFTWNNSLISLDCLDYTTTIEFFMDNLTNPNDSSAFISDPACSSATIDEEHTIDFFNQNTYTVDYTNGFSVGTKCIWWRIVIDGRECGARRNIKCITTTQWYYLNVN